MSTLTGNPLTSEPKSPRSIFRATAVLSTSSVVTILLGLVTSKVNAVFLEPKGYGYMGLLQGMVNLIVLGAGFGMGSGIVKIGASRVAQNDQGGISAIWQAAKLIVGAASILAVMVVVLFRRTLSLWFLGTAEHPWSVALMGIAVVFTLAAGLKTNILNAYHRVGAMAKNSAIGALLTTLCAILLIMIWREKGIVPSIIAGSVVTWLVGGYLLKKEIGRMPERPRLHETLQAARALLRFGGPFTASMMVGTAVQMTLPILVLHMLGAESVGYYRAATSISVTYLGFLITAMVQDYYPRVSAVSDRSELLSKLINDQQRLVLLLGVPMILGTLALVPLLVPLVYSLKFAPTVEILEWQLIGDLFKFSSWTMSFAIVARCSSSTYFFTELVGGVSTIATSWLCIHWFGLPGLGISFVATYFIYYLVVWAIIHREIGLIWTKTNKRLLAAAVCAGIFIRILPYTTLKAFRTPVGLVLALGAGSWSLVEIAREIGDSKRLKPLQRAVLGLISRIKSQMP
jgi:antigen flippase